MYFDYLNVLIFTAVGFVFVIANMIIGSFVRPKRKTDRGLEIYECGEETIGDTWIQFDIRYYTVALIYVIFAVEIAFLFPWAMVLKTAFANADIGLWALAKGFLFVTILLFGLVAVWAKGDLDWILTWSGGPYDPDSEDKAPPIPSLEELTPEPEAEASDSEDTEEEAA
jgi:NADH-quinone oxidoreductase subunit A